MTSESPKRKKSNKKNKTNKHEGTPKAGEINIEQDQTKQKHIEKTQGSSSFQDEVMSKLDSEDIQNNLDDSHDDDQPKKKKKKKKATLPETNNSKGKKSIRQMKREKFAKKQAEEKAAAKDTMKSECLSYLSQWKYNRQNWKFMKIKQVWLNKNKFSSQLVPESSWHTLIEYFESAKGNIRNLLLEDANKVIKQMDEWTESQSVTDNKDGEANESEKPIKPDETTYKRARDLLQFLAE